MSGNGDQLRNDYARIEKAIAFIDQHFPTQPSLAEVAASVGLSEFHFQRLFRRWVGISPKRFQQYLTKEHAKDLLARSRSVLDATYRAGLSSPSRLHDLLVTCEAVTPGEFRSGGDGLTIRYAFHSTPFGEVLLGSTARGICWLSFVREDRGGKEREVRRLAGSWRRARLVQGSNGHTDLLEGAFAMQAANDGEPIRLVLKGTNFQIKVWEALLDIPAGCVVSYEDVAHRIGKPDSSRAVGNAVGANPIAFLIPCHRVIRKVGSFGNYGGGPERKKAMLAWETVKSAAFGVGEESAGADETAGVG